MLSDINADVDFGQILVEKNIIKAEELLKAEQARKTEGGYLSQHLINLGFIKDTELTSILTCQYGFCYLPLKAYDIQDNALQLIPFNLACD